MHITKDLGTTEIRVRHVRAYGWDRRGDGESVGRGAGTGREEGGREAGEGEQVERRTIIPPCAYPEKFDVMHDVEIRDVA